MMCTAIPYCRWLESGLKDDKSNISMPSKPSIVAVMGPMPTTKVSFILPPVTFFTPPAIKKMFGFSSYPYTRSEPLPSLNRAALSFDVSFLDMPNALVQVGHPWTTEFSDVIDVRDRSTKGWSMADAPDDINLPDVLDGIILPGSVILIILKKYTHFGAIATPAIDRVDPFEIITFQMDKMMQLLLQMQDQITKQKQRMDNLESGRQNAMADFLSRKEERDEQKEKLPLKWELFFQKEEAKFPAEDEIINQNQKVLHQSRRVGKGRGRNAAAPQGCPKKQYLVMDPHVANRQLQLRQDNPYFSVDGPEKDEDTCIGWGNVTFGSGLVPVLGTLLMASCVWKSPCKSRKLDDQQGKHLHRNRAPQKDWKMIIYLTDRSDRPKAQAPACSQ
uniref:Uncharacterized protein n=1 Tax=Romanomermis culicivorax TaxID=13658 RepID=A0A915JT99_ROMCU